MDLPYTSGVRGKPSIAIFAALALGVVIGFVLGGIAPRRELAHRDEELERLSRALARAERGGGGSGWRSPVPGLDRILRAPEEPAADAPLEPASAPRPEIGERDPASDPVDPDVSDAGTPRALRDRWQARRSPDERLEAFQRAASVQRVRVVQSRAALFEQAGLTGDEQREVDEALRELNEELYGHGEELILLVMGEEPPTPRDLLGVTHDVTGILHRAQVRIEEIVGPERVSGVDESALEIWNHVDIAQLEPAARAAVGR